MFKYTFDWLTLSFIQPVLLLSVFLVVKLIYLIGTENRYKYITILSLLVVLIFLNFYQKIQTYLFIFLLLTELTSLYLVLIITLNTNYFKVSKASNMWVIGLLVVAFNTVSTGQYHYFEFYTIYYTGSFNQFLFILQAHYLAWIVLLIIFLTIFVLFLLVPKVHTNKQNILHVFTTLVSFINQIPSNLNLFSRPTILKWS